MQTDASKFFEKLSIKKFKKKLLTVPIFSEFPHPGQNDILGLNKRTNNTKRLASFNLETIFELIK